jgi:hypothetical protein
VEFIGTGWAWTECAKASWKTTYRSHSLDLKNVTGNLGRFRVPRGEDVVRVRPKVSQEMFQ